MKKFFILGVLAFLPAVSYAQTYDVSTLGGIAIAISGVLETIFPVIVSISVFLIVWFTFKMILNAGDSEKRTQAMHGIFWSIVGVFLLYSIWGVIRIFVNTIKFGDTTPITTPILFEGQP